MLRWTRRLQKEVSFEFTPIVPTLNIIGTDALFPIRRVYGLAYNYAAPDADPNAAKKTPVFFSKPSDSVVSNHARVPFPAHAKQLNYEIELVVALGRKGRCIPEEHALNFVYGYGAGIDFTCKDVLTEAAKNGWPWDFAKGLDFGAPCSAIHSVRELDGHVAEAKLELRLNDEVKQDGDVRYYAWDTKRVIAELSKRVELHPGDLIYMGTPPAGVGPVSVGDKVAGRVGEQMKIEVDITSLP